MIRYKQTLSFLKGFAKSLVRRLNEVKFKSLGTVPNSLKLKYGLGALLAMSLSGCEVNSELITSINPIPAEQMSVYKAHIPDYPGFGPSATPQTKLEVGRLNDDDGFMETRLFIRINYLKKDYWWGLDQPLNSQWGYEKGLPIGYPKRLVKMCRSDTGHSLQYKIDDCINPKLTVTHTELTGQPKPLRDTTSGQLTLGTDSCLKVSGGGKSGAKPDKAKPIRYGLVTTVNNYDDATTWKALFPSGDRPGYAEWLNDRIYYYITPNVTCKVRFKPKTP
jgi:hypothetical protein